MKASPEYVLRKNRKKGGKSTRGPPGIGFNLTENGDYDISGHKLVNVKQPENPGDAVNLQYLGLRLDSFRLQVDEVHNNLITKDDSESVLKIVKPELENMIKKNDAESVLKIVKPEMDNMIKKDDSESVLKIVKPELSNMITKDSLNLTATRGYIDIGNRRLVKTANAIDKYDVRCGSKEHKCGWEKCRNCYKEVEICRHKCYMQWKRQKGGICQTKIKERGKEYKVKGCKNCDRKDCTVTFPDKTNKRVKYHIYQCKECENCVKIPRKTGRVSPESKTKNENGYQCLN
ncbi:hypothetical protein Zmor_019322 [Zophobas morio]|uniref:Uncharacterized protein n=1 Tax=Zophobas morio TaxID=2755281 RepID=A0AA38I5Q2_9CUCU|nr:hypothetical protein Zmor_019322 [Zophobas morio]